MSNKWYQEKIFGPLTYGHITVLVIAIILVPNVGNITNFVGETIDTAQEVIFDDGVVGEEFTEDDSLDENPVELDVFVKCYEGKGSESAGLGVGTTSDQKIMVFHDDNGEVGTLYAVVTTSSGSIQVPGPIYSNSYLWAQPRAAAPDAADPYLGKIVRFHVPSAASGGYDANDDVTFTLWVRDATATSPTFAVKDGAGATIDDNSADYFNTTDTTFQILLNTIDADTWYGGENQEVNGEHPYIIDYATGDLWEQGVFFVWKGTVSQPFTSYTYTFSDPTNIYYVWRIADYIVDDSLTTEVDDIFSSMLGTDGSSLNADATVVLDVYDMLKVGTGLAWRGATSSSDLLNGVSLDVTAITTKVA